MTTNDIERVMQNLHDYATGANSTVTITREEAGSAANVLQGWLSDHEEDE